MKRKLSLAEAVEAASILFELNSNREALRRVAENAVLQVPGDPAEADDKLWLEWAAFVHAAVLYALMAHAPNVVVVEYLRTTRNKLSGRGLDEAGINEFVDASFSPYVQPLLRDEARECPDIFFRHLLGRGIAEVDANCAAVISGTMAMVLAAVVDKLEQYDFMTE